MNEYKSLLVFRENNNIVFYAVYYSFLDHSLKIRVFDMEK